MKHFETDATVSSLQTRWSRYIKPSAKRLQDGVRNGLDAKTIDLGLSGENCCYNFHFILHTHFTFSARSNQMQCVFGIVLHMAEIHGSEFCCSFFSHGRYQVTLYYYVFVFMNIILTCLRNSIEHGIRRDRLGIEMAICSPNSCPRQVDL